jgi:hypothetical protein
MTRAFVYYKVDDTRVKQMLYIVVACPHQTDTTYDKVMHEILLSNKQGVIITR